MSVLEATTLLVPSMERHIHLRLAAIKNWNITFKIISKINSRNVFKKYFIKLGYPTMTYERIMLTETNVFYCSRH